MNRIDAECARITHVWPGTPHNFPSNRLPDLENTGHGEGACRQSIEPLEPVVRKCAHVRDRTHLQSGSVRNRRAHEGTRGLLNKHYAAGTFIASGRKIPRDGGIILALAEDKQQVEAIMAEDPFCKHGLAEVRVIEFRVSQRAGDLPKRLEG